MLTVTIEIIWEQDRVHGESSLGPRQDSQKTFPPLSMARLWGSTYRGERALETLWEGIEFVTMVTEKEISMKPEG